MPPALQQLPGPSASNFSQPLAYSTHHLSTPPPSSPRIRNSNPQEPHEPHEADDAAGGDASLSKQKGKPLSRRGHFKSRLGCFNCKRRRVKCTEQRPACSPCCRLGLTCAYPSPGASSTGPPRPSLPQLQYEDLRFYHQFLTAAFPTVPINAVDVWLQAGAMSHNFEHLTHAVLGLGASHLSQHGHISYNEPALQHRVVAMRLANSQLVDVPKTAAEADALFATLLCLVTQSSLLPGGMVDYLTMLRGAFLVLSMVLSKFENSIFRHLTIERHLSSLESLASEQPRDMVALDRCRRAIMDLQPYCRSPAEKAYQAGLVKSIDDTIISSTEGWRSFVIVFLMPCSFTNEDFLNFVHPDSHISHLLAMHGFLVDYLLGQFCVAPGDMPKFTGRRSMIMIWARNLANSLPPGYRKFMKWALEFCEGMETLDGRYLLSP